MKLAVTVVLETEKEENALRVVSRLNKLISADLTKLEKYHKGGTKALLQKDLSETHWPDAYLAGISVAQSFGRGWTVCGCANEELDLIGEDFSVSGIVWAHLHMSRCMNDSNPKTNLTRR